LERDYYARSSPGCHFIFHVRRNNGKGDTETTRASASFDLPTLAKRPASWKLAAISTGNPDWGTKENSY
jgi:hypothetical protein